MKIPARYRNLSPRFLDLFHSMQAAVLRASAKTSPLHSTIRIRLIEQRHWLQFALSKIITDQQLEKLGIDRMGERKYFWGCPNKFWNGKLFTCSIQNGWHVGLNFQYSFKVLPKENVLQILHVFPRQTKRVPVHSCYTRQWNKTLSTTKNNLRAAEMKRLRDEIGRDTHTCKYLCTLAQETTELSPANARCSSTVVPRVYKHQRCVLRWNTYCDIAPYYPNTELA